MGLYNYVYGALICPRCGEKVEVEVECRSGYTAEMKAYRVGDRYEWMPREAVQNGGRPANGDCNGDGYTDCPHCEKDFFVNVEIRGDVVQTLSPDLTRQPLIPD